jgi:ketosteroid isomerase-like protein
MSEENVEIFRALYAAFNRGDLDTFFQHTSPEVAVDAWPANLGAEPRYCGHTAVRTHFEHMLSLFDEIRFEPEEVVEIADDLVLVMVHSQVRGKRSGVPVSARIVHLWRHANRRGIDLRVFATRAEALEAAGLKE